MNWFWHVRSILQCFTVVLSSISIFIVTSDDSYFSFNRSGFFSPCGNSYKFWFVPYPAEPQFNTVMWCWHPVLKKTKERKQTNKKTMCHLAGPQTTGLSLIGQSSQNVRSELISGYETPSVLSNDVSSGPQVQNHMSTNPSPEWETPVLALHSHTLLTRGYCRSTGPPWSPPHPPPPPPPSGWCETQLSF